MLTFIVVVLFVGLVAGAVARAIVPGNDPLGIGGTIVLGIVGSFVGGFLGHLLAGGSLDDDAVQPSGWIGSIIGAVIVLFIYRAMRRRPIS